MSIRPAQAKSAMRHALLAAALLCGAHPAQAQSLLDCDTLSYEQVRDRTIAPLMAAMRAGDVTTIQAHLSAEMSARYATLLTRNSAYPSHLRERYGDSNHLLHDVVVSEQGYTALIEIYWPDGTREVFEFDLGADNPHLPPPGSLGSCSTQ